MWRKETIKNKICALVLIGTGFFSIFLENDSTVFIFFCLIGVPLFFAKENWITDEGGDRLCIRRKPEGKFTERI